MPLDEPAVCATHDHLGTIEMRMQGQSVGLIEKLYAAARDKQREPLAYAAASGLLERVTPGDRVLIITGSGTPPYMTAGETDGPPGAAALARVLVLGLGAKVVFTSDPRLLPPIVAAVQATGLNAREYDTMLQMSYGAAFEEFPNDDADAQEHRAAEILDRLQPSAVISIERGSPNRAGIRHSATGMSKGEPHLARLHLLTDAARARGIFTIGVGDNGNEIGFGNIGEAVRKHSPWGERCQCPCGQGLAAIAGTDVLVVAATSNWGAYAVEAALALLLGNPELMHDTEMEWRMIEHCSLAGAADGATGMLTHSVDGVAGPIQAHITDLMAFTIRQAMRVRKRDF